MTTYDVELFDTSNTSVGPIHLESTTMHDAIKEVLGQTYWEFTKALISLDGDNWLQINKQGKIIACSLPLLHPIQTS